MNIVIAGIGKFGKELTAELSTEKHNITIIDSKSAVVEDIVNQYDVMGYTGNAASYNTQVEALVNKADLFIATTSNDEMNILCCLVAKKLGVKQTIARLRNPEYAQQAQLMQNELGVNMSLNPDSDTAGEIYRIFRFPSATKVESFANGRVSLVELKLEEDSLLINKSLEDIRKQFNAKILICAVNRLGEVIIPKGNFVLEEDDILYIIADMSIMTHEFKKLKLFKNTLKSCLIIGGSKITYNLAKQLIETGVSVKIIEKEKSVCELLCDSLPEALIIHGEGTNHKLLLEEGIETVDAVITLTGMDETNIVISSYAKSLGCEKVITKVNSSNYELILNSVGLTSIISPKEIFSNNIIRFVRGMENTMESEFKTLYRLVGNKVEALEFVISKETNYTNIPIKDLKIKKGFLLGSIIRADKVIIPSGMDTLQPLDSVVIVTTNKNIKDISEILE